MSTVSAKKSLNPKGTEPKKTSAKSSTTARPKVESAGAGAEKVSNPNKTTIKETSAKSNAPSRHKVAAAAANPEKPPRSVETKAERAAAAGTLQALVTSPEATETREPNLEHLTKQDCMLTLLSRPEGASIEEMMRATDWQQHSVRGFLAGTLKRKLGFSLTSSKAVGGVRRYRIETRRGR